MTAEPNDLDRLLDPGWRERAAEAGAYWRKTFQTRSERTQLAIQETAAIKRKQGRWQRLLALCRMGPRP